MSPEPKPLLQLLIRTAALGFLGACMVFVGPTDRNDDIRDLVAARARWNTVGLTDYDVTAQALCFCPMGGQSVRVSVRGGRVVSAVEVATGQPLSPAPLSQYRPVEGLFDVIEDAVERRAHRIEASYHRQLGYPTKFQIDYLENAADDEYGYEILSFTPAT